MIAKIMMMMNGLRLPSIIIYSKSRGKITLSQNRINVQLDTKFIGDEL